MRPDETLRVLGNLRLQAHHVKEVAAMSGLSPQRTSTALQALQGCGFAGYSYRRRVWVITAKGRTWYAQESEQ